VSGRPVVYVLVVLAVGGAIAAFVTSTDLAVALVAAFVATASAAAASGLALGERLRWPSPPPPAPEVDPSVLLRDALRGGTFARQNAIAHLRALERSMPGALSPLTDEEIARALALARREFLAWIDQRVRSLEGGT
jgi:hypothetical protein